MSNHLFLNALKGFQQDLLALKTGYLWFAGFNKPYLDNSIQVQVDDDAGKLYLRYVIGAKKQEDVIEDRIGLDDLDPSSRLYQFLQQPSSLSIYKQWDSLLLCMHDILSITSARGHTRAIETYQPKSSAEFTAEDFKHVRCRYEGIHRPMEDFYERNMQYTEKVIDANLEITQLIIDALNYKGEPSSFLQHQIYNYVSPHPLVMYFAMHSSKFSHLQKCKKYMHAELMLPVIVEDRLSHLALFHIHSIDESLKDNNLKALITTLTSKLKFIKRLGYDLELDPGPQAERVKENRRRYLMKKELVHLIEEALEYHAELKLWTALRDNIVEFCDEETLIDSITELTAGLEKIEDFHQQLNAGHINLKKYPTDILDTAYVRHLLAKESYHGTSGAWLREADRLWSLSLEPNFNANFIKNDHEKSLNQLRDKLASRASRIQHKIDAIKSKASMSVEERQLQYSNLLLKLDELTSFYSRDPKEVTSEELKIKYAEYELIENNEIIFPELKQRFKDIKALIHTTTFTCALNTYEGIYNELQNKFSRAYDLHQKNDVLMQFSEQAKADESFFNSPHVPVEMKKRFLALSMQRKHFKMTTVWFEEINHLRACYFNVAKGRQSKNEGIFNKYLKERQVYYYARDTLDTFVRYFSFVFFGFLWYETSHTLRAKYVDRLERAFIAYQRNPCEIMAKRLETIFQEELKNQPNYSQRAWSLFFKSDPSPKPRTLKAKVIEFKRRVDQLEQRRVAELGVYPALTGGKTPV